MAQARVVNARARLDGELENLQRMLPVWRASLRHEAQFGRQFEVLANELIARADPQDRGYAQARIAAMLAEHLPPDSGKE